MVNLCLKCKQCLGPITYPNGSIVTEERLCWYTCGDPVLNRPLTKKVAPNGAVIECDHYYGVDEE